MNFIIAIINKSIINNQKQEAECKPRRGRVDTPAEVGHLQLASNADEKVLRFYVPVDDALRVAVLERGSELRDVARRARLVEATIGCALKLLVELSAGRQLEHEEYSLLVGEKGIQFQNIRVAVRRRFPFVINKVQYMRY